MKIPFLLASLTACGNLFAQNLVVNGGFESPPISWPDRQPFTSFTGWYTGNLNADPTYGVDLISLDYWTPHSGNQSLDLVSDYCSAGNFLRQDITTVPQQRYQVCLWYANSFAATSTTAHLFVKDGANDLINQELTHSGSTPANMGWQLFSTEFVAQSTSTTIMFVHDSAVTQYPGNTGLALDDVSLVAVPEPAIGLLMGVGAVAIFLRQRRESR